jgi:hypothetical protein
VRSRTEEIEEDKIYTDGVTPQSYRGGGYYYRHSLHLHPRIRQSILLIEVVLWRIGVVLSSDLR